MNTTPTTLNNITITIRRSGTLVVRNKKGSKIETKTTETKKLFFLSSRERGRHRISANFFPVSQKSWPKSVNFFFTASPKNRKYHLQKWCSFIRLSYLRLKFFVSKGVFIHKITSEGWQTIREGRARLWEP